MPTQEITPYKGVHHLGIQDKVVVEEREDEMFWEVTNSRSFYVKSLYSILEEVRVGPFPSSIVWNAWVPPKRDPSRVVWFVHWKKEDESVESSAFVPFLDNLEEEQ
ncbi:hypothetical protein CK203_023401 [Vitis vinifera]|uniref:Uncharacterized protein n=1 Tax=Vitis vinifera TaxID=29760 RepID=A0A438J6F4_VITVI|nr:hypothetical protein CK203_023401 [Vitis vinifera]